MSGKQDAVRRDRVCPQPTVTQTVRRRRRAQTTAEPSGLSTLRQSVCFLKHAYMTASLTRDLVIKPVRRDQVFRKTGEENILTFFSVPLFCYKFPKARFRSRYTSASSWRVVDGQPNTRYYISLSLRKHCSGFHCARCGSSPGSPCWWRRTPFSPSLLRYFYLPEKNIYYFWIDISQIAIGLLSFATYLFTRNEPQIPPFYN